MRLFVTTVALLALTIPTALAEDGGAGQPGKGGKGKDDGARAKILKRFDENGNGKLDPVEKEKLKKWREENGKGKGPRKGPTGKRGPGAGKTGKPDGTKKGTPPKKSGGRFGTPPVKSGG